MKKLDEGIYLYKGVKVYKLSNGNYTADILVNDYKLPITIIGATQAAFKKIFNNKVKDNGGLKESK